MRKAEIHRKTAETEIDLHLDLDGTGRFEIQTGVGFFDHMLDQVAKHARLDMTISAKGDTHIDDHHTVEDVGIAFGMAIKAALAEKRGIRRYGHSLLPMDDALVEASLDMSGRPFLVWGVDIPCEKIGTFDASLVREFFQAVSSLGGITLHLEKRAGFNGHHIAEATFKAFARALREAVELDASVPNAIPSTKGSL